MLSKEKGNRAESSARDILKKYTKLNWERTPLSGALDKKHCLSGDLYIPKKNNAYTIEVKHYKDSAINHKLLLSGSQKLYEWWEQAKREAEENNNTPLLIFKHDRSKFYVVADCLGLVSNIITIDAFGYCLEIALLEDWLSEVNIEFIKE